MSFRITKKEFVTLKHLAKGKTNREIARLEKVVTRTIEARVYNLMQITQMPNRTKLAIHYIKNEKDFKVKTKRERA